MAKPSDFFLGVTDLFSVILPGGAFSFILVRFVQTQPTLAGIANRLGLMHWAENTPKYIAFLVAAYLVGHGLDMVGAFLLDKIYDRTYARPKRARQLAAMNAAQTEISSERGRKITPDKSGDELLDRAKLIAGPAMPSTDRVFQWCRAWLLLKNPGAFLEVERVQGNSKFFRAMVSAFVGTALILASGGFLSGLLGAAACTLLAAGSFLRFCDLRWKAVEQTYRLYIAMHVEPGSSLSEAPHDCEAD